MIKRPKKGPKKALKALIKVFYISVPTNLFFTLVQGCAILHNVVQPLKVGKWQAQPARSKFREVQFFFLDKCWQVRKSSKAENQLQFY